ILTIELEVWDAPFGGLSNELLTSQAKQLGCLSTRYFSLTIEFEHDKLARRLFHRAMQLFEQINEILIEFDLDGSHDHAIVHPRARKHRRAAHDSRIALNHRGAVLCGGFPLCRAASHVSVYAGDLSSA